MPLTVRISDDIKTEAAEVLAGFGLTLSDAVRIFLTSVATKKSLPPELVMSDADYEAWLGERLMRAMEDRDGSRPAREFLDELADARDDA